MLPAIFRLRSCLSGRTSRPALRSSTIARQSDASSGPTYSPSTDAIGAMSQAPRHSNACTWKSGVVAGRAQHRARSSASAPRSEHEMFVQT